jgi:hypothetical protein
VVTVGEKKKTESSINRARDVGNLFFFDATSSRPVRNVPEEFRSIPSGNDRFWLWEDGFCLFCQGALVTSLVVSSPSLVSKCGEMP